MELSFFKVIMIRNPINTTVIAIIPISLPIYLPENLCIISDRMFTISATECPSKSEDFMTFDALGKAIFKGKDIKCASSFVST